MAFRGNHAPPAGSEKAQSAVHQAANLLEKLTDMSAHLRTGTGGSPLALNIRPDEIKPPLRADTDSGVRAGGRVAHDKHSASVRAARREKHPDQSGVRASDTGRVSNGVRFHPAGA